MTIANRHLTPVFSALALLLLPSARAQDVGYDASEHLKPLEWMVGEWTGEYPVPAGPTMMATRTARWVHDRNFLYVEIAFRGGAEESTTHAVYRWDPVERTIRLWVLGSGGTWNQGVVEAEEGMNRVRITAGITAEGKPITATGTFRRTGADAMTIQWTEVSIDGEPRPDGPECTLRRQ